jgi:hypothetical protein
MSQVKSEPGGGVQSVGWTAEYGVLAGAMMLTAVLCFGMALLPRCINTDGVFFIQLARQVATGGSFFHPQVAITPGYSALLAVVQAITGGGYEAVARYLAAGASVVVLLPLWAIWRGALGRPAADMAVCLAAVWPVAIEYGSGVYYEAPAMILILGGWWAWLRLWSGQNWAWALVAGVAWGAVAWMKPEVLAWGGVGALILCLGGQWRRALILAFVVGMVYVPYVGQVHQHTGQWRLAAKQDVNVAKAEAVGSRDYHAELEARREVAEHGDLVSTWPGPVTLAKRLGINLYLLHRYAVSQTWPAVMVVLVGAGWALAWSRRQLGIWLLLPALALAPLLFFQIEARLWYPLFAGVLGLAGTALQAAGRWRWPLLAASCLLLVPTALRPAYRPHVDEAGQRAGLWLRQRGEATYRILDRKPFVSYYSGSQQIWPRARPGLAGLRQALENQGPVIIVVDNRYFRRSRPEWFVALERPPDWLEELARFEGPEGHLVRLLAFSGT